MKKNCLMIAMFVFAFLGSSLFADGGGASTGDLSSTLNSIESQIRTVVPAVALLMIVLAGLIYGIGQVMGAEMRGRASVWAQALLVGAILGLVITAMAGPLVGLFENASPLTSK